MYSISDFGDMITDTTRMAAYVEALRQNLPPDGVVVDIGTGTGIFALLACRFGARRVYAIETNDAIQVARELARANGYADRIEFIQAMSTGVTLPEPADLMISDLRGALPLYSHHLPAIIDARQRLLAPGGRQIPQRDTLWAAVIEAEHVYQRYTSPWLDNPYDLDMRAAHNLVIHSWGKRKIAPDQFLTEAGCWASLDYTTLTSPHVRGGTSWTVSRAGTAYGYAMWFDAIVADDIGYSNAPGRPECIYGHQFFPWLEPVELAPNDRVSLDIQAHLVGDDYIWNWATRVESPAGSLKAHFQQSSFQATPLSPAHLRRRAANYIPQLNTEGQIDGLIMGLMAAGTAVGDMARAVAEQFPDRFATWQAAMPRVGRLSQKYSC